MNQKFTQGDYVEWNAGGGKSQGTVKKMITEPQEIDGNTIDASSDDPRYLVENDNTGKVTGHTPEALTTIDSSKKDNSSSSSERQQLIDDFHDAVNMTAKEIEDWLDTEESKSVGQKDENGKIKGRESGKEIIEILNKNQSDYTKADCDRMKKVVSYVHRHLAQKPSGDIEHSNWRYSLMNWGNDPLK